MRQNKWRKLLGYTNPVLGTSKIVTIKNDRRSRRITRILYPDPYFDLLEGTFYAKPDISFLLDGVLYESHGFTVKTTPRIKWKVNPTS